MKNEKMKIFESEKLMAIAAIAAFIAGIAKLVTSRIVDGGANVQHVFYVGLGAAALFLFFSYRRHDKNVMKGLLGVLLTIAVCNELCFLYGYYQVMLAQFYELQYTLGVAFAAIEVIFVLMQALIFLGHFFINADHHSNPALVSLNQTCLLMMLAVILIQKVFTVAMIGTTALSLVDQVFWCVQELGVFTTVICIESKLDAFRVAREAK